MGGRYEFTVGNSCLKEGCFITGGGVNVYLCKLKLENNFNQIDCCFVNIIASQIIFSLVLHFVQQNFLGFGRLFSPSQCQ